MSSEPRRPNVVVYISHDTGRFLESYGVETVHTPHLSKFAEDSAQFDNAWCTTPLCAPARSALVTGQPHHQNGMMGLPGDTLGAWDLVAKDRHLAWQFRNAGYESVLCGFLHETRDLFSVGFEKAFHGIGKGNNGGSGGIAGSDKDIAEWLDSREDDRPFFLQIGSGETHRQWKTSDPDDSKGVWKAPYLIDSPEVDADMAAMQGSTQELDRGIGAVFDLFEERGLADDTIFCITTDHGIDFPRAKGTLFDPGIEVFLFMRYRAGGWKSGVRMPQLISHLDLYPTLLEAAGLPVPEKTDGRSFLPLLTGEGDYEEREYIFSEKTYHDNYDPMRSVRSKTHKYVMNFDAQTLYDVRIATAPRYNWFRFPINKREREELYDLREDPHESNNLTRSEEHQEIQDQLRKVVADWMAATEDPLLDGPVPSPYHLRACARMKELADAAR